MEERNYLNLKEEKNCAYLRKSRLDLEAESHGQGETLLKHEQELKRTADRLEVKIDKFYREIESGETIAERPQMIKLLQDIQSGLWDNIFVIEIERLARGDSFDQAYITQIFKYSNIKIITPNKIFYPKNEYDEEFLEYSLFMSRREYKTINRRLVNGRVASVRQGKYVGNKAPYGFKTEKIKGDKGFKLVPNQDEVDTCILIFELYGNNPELSINGLANELNKRGLKPRLSNEWSINSLSDILRNPVVIGKLRWNRRQGVKKFKDGKIEKSRPRNENYILSNGLHNSIISVELWNRVQEKLTRNSPPVPHNCSLVNPFSGIIKCEVCGKNMIRRPYKKRDIPATLICTNKKCNNISTKMYLVEDKILETLKAWCSNYKINCNVSSDNETLIISIKRNIEKTKSLIANEKCIINKIYSNYEENIYTQEVFKERLEVRKENIAKLETNLKSQNKDLQSLLKIKEEQTNFIPKVRNVIDVYYLPEISVEQKQALLKEVIEKVLYLKTEKVSRGQADDKFTLKIFPRIPKNPEDL